MEDEEGSIATTPTWAVAAVSATMILLALLIEHVFHLLKKFLGRRNRRTLNRALYHAQAELRGFGFMSLMLGIAGQPISKICIPERMGDSFLPCDNTDIDSSEAGGCPKGKLPLISTKGTNQLLLLIVMLAVSHVLTCLVTFTLTMAKMSRWASWEDETKSLDYQLSQDPRRFRLARQTSFGRRHMKIWSNYRSLSFLVCFWRQIINPVTKADYATIRHSFIVEHFGQECKFNFHKFLTRSLDHDFMVVATISHWSWVYAFLFIFFSAKGLHSYFWMPIIPLLMLLIVGTKLEIILPKMCMESSKETTVVPGTLCLKPDTKYFWFGKQEWLLHLIHFALFQNSFQLAFFSWTWYNFGFPSCFHTGKEEIVISITVAVLVQVFCAYVILPLYALVTQMDSTLKSAIFSDKVIEGLRRWRGNAGKTLAMGRSAPTTPNESLHSRMDCGQQDETYMIDMLELEQPVDDHGEIIAVQEKVEESERPFDDYGEYIVEEEIEIKSKDVIQEEITHKTISTVYDGEASFGMWHEDDDQLPDGIVLER